MHGDDAWIQTYSGKMFWPLDPKPQDVFIEDIAHALALKCRYGGHCLDFYSVAQHSCLVADVVWRDGGNARAVLTALLHDAAEAYTADVVRPVKKHIKQFGEIEERLERVIAERFNLIYPFPPGIKRADSVLLLTEARDIMTAPPKPWQTFGVRPANFPIVPVSWQNSKEAFLAKFHELVPF